MSSGNAQHTEPPSEKLRKNHISDNRDAHSLELMQANASTSGPIQSGAVRQITEAVSPSHTSKSPSPTDPEAKASSPSLMSTEGTHQNEQTDTFLHGAKAIASAVSPGVQHRKAAFSGPARKVVKITSEGPMATARKAEFVDVPLEDAEDEGRAREREEDESWERLDCPAHLQKKK